MLRDVMGIAIALGAAWMAERPSDNIATYGYRRYEVLGAFVNGLLLVGLIAFIAIDASRRLVQPDAVQAWPVLAVGILGLLFNAAGIALLHAGASQNLNLRGAYLEVLADALGSLGVIMAATIILLTGWTRADAVVALIIALWMVPRTWSLLRDAGRVLLEFTPAGVSLERIGSEMAAHDEVVEVHDLHVWEITSGFSALSAHVLVGADNDCHACRRELERLLKERFGIEHTTLQVDHAQTDARVSVDEISGRGTSASPNE